MIIYYEVEVKTLSLAIDSKYELELIFSKLNIKLTLLELIQLG